MDPNRPILHGRCSLDLTKGNMYGNEDHRIVKWFKDNDARIAALETELAAVKFQKDETSKVTTKYMQLYDTARAALARFELLAADQGRELVGLRKDFRHYGRHSEGCSYPHSEKYGCKCGFLDALTGSTA